MITEHLEASDFGFTWGFALFEVRGNRQRGVLIRKYFRQPPNAGRVTRFKDQNRNLLRKSLKRAPWHPISPRT